MAYAERGFYRAEWYIEGKRYTRATGIEANGTKKNKEVADRLQAQWRKEMVIEIKAAEKNRVRGPRGKLLDQTLDEAVAEYWEEKGQFAKGYRDIKADFERIIGYLGPNFMLGDIDTEVIIGMMQRRAREHIKLGTKDGKPPVDKRTGLPKHFPKLVSARTVNITVGERLKWFLSYMAGKGRQVQPIQWDKVWRRENPRITEFTYDTELLMRETYRKDHLPCLQFALLGGPRRRQFVELQWDEIDFRARVITFKSFKKKARKGMPPEPYRIALTTAMEDLILSQIDPEKGRPYHPEYVWTFVAERTYFNAKAGQHFVKGQRYRLTYEGLGTEWARWKAEHGLSEKVRMHDLRHAHGHRMGEVADPLTVRDGMGHGDLSTTERYMGRAKVERIRTAQEARERLDAERLAMGNPTQGEIRGNL